MNTFTWSFSSFKEYVNCPRQYHATRVLKEYEKKPSKEMLYGSEVHKALEDYVCEGKKLAKNYQRFKARVDQLVAIPGEKLTEKKMAITYDRTPCEFDSNDRWVRGIADLLIIDGNHAFVVDYKTGSSRYPDPKQLRLMALMTFAHYPEVETVKGGLLFLMNDVFIPEEYKRSSIEESWGHFTPTLARLQNSYDTGTWPPNTTPLCRFCPVSTCEFNRS